ncbi:hypothetical protein PCANC_27414 [Puccinia coronata f. sp. avenae]|uniref:Holocytochrome c-type synthase n=1 Tax=Puccinia coronata f. sp. avenae TaxID=200324 RepID=A0A2N5TBH7_9BASI|nr:hypothetical protein PCASD_23263 [Puccinia coronata f. sp. avenae]PLW22826.1 hypothetical protein PCANC_27414 [Puccinia coronata f. sp. avenae]
MWPFSSSSSTSAPSAEQATCPVEHTGKIREHGRSQPTTHPISDHSRLPNDRVISSIPRYRPELNENDSTRTSPPDEPVEKTACPVDHQAPVASTTTTEHVEQNWIYPSPSQFYNALKRKNKNPRAEDMYTIVPIHNAVNERVWTQVLEWEAGYGRGSFDRWPRSGKSGPMLSSFRGRPDDLTPRAWLKVLSGYQAPFDRHDWEVIRPTEERMRYVVDFYPGKGADSSIANATTNSSDPNHQPVPNLSFYLDVRPALDSWEGVRMRLLRAWDDIVGPKSPSSSPSEPGQKS